MRYLLVVGFVCDVYRREPRARIFVDDKLIDEFYIPNHKDSLTPFYKNISQNKHFLQPITKHESAKRQIKHFPSLRFYEIEIDQQQDKLKLCIDIDNNDSNCTNGFITKSTLLQLRVFYFFPLNQKLLSRLIKIREKNKMSKNFAWYNMQANIFDLSYHWKWFEKNKKNDIYVCWFENQRSYTMPYTDNIGGSGSFLCEMNKKYGILIPKIKKSYRYDLSMIFINYILDKYKQHENQRNTD